jgi:RNA ligase
LTVATAPYTPDLTILRDYEARGLISIGSHPSKPLLIANYTHKAMRAGAWDEHTTNCRGLIFRPDGEVVARPFRKFFNLGESHCPPLPDEPYEVYEKLDGSLGILYHDGDDWAIATRGSFTSEQAIAATRLLHASYKHTLEHLSTAITYLFEIILPWNRIVVDYGQTEDLALLAMVQNRTGDELNLVYGRAIGFTTAPTSPSRDIWDLFDDDPTNREGYVVRFQSGLRVKVKFDLYRKLHRLVTGLSTKGIWELLKDGQSLEGIPGWYLAPPEMRQWAEEVAADLYSEYHAILKSCMQDYGHITTDLCGPPYSDRPLHRRWFAGHAKEYSRPAALFAIYDDKEALVTDILWKELRPTYARPFKVAEAE